MLFDLTDRKSFDGLALWLDYVQSYDKTIPIVLVGTKKDLKQKEVIPAEDIRVRSCSCALSSQQFGP
jgi:GTPase SAR1 family protein